MTKPVDLPRILLVDDEPHLLDGLRRQLRREFSVETAVGAAKGLFALGQGEPFEVIVSDFLMPGINGAEFLAASRKVAPDATRMLLTGHTALTDAALTVNQGQVFRMLLKPVDHETMTAALRDCVAQHRLVRSERELLEQTLNGSVKALMDVLSVASPAAFGRGTRMSRMATAMLGTEHLGTDHLGTGPAEQRWAVELAVMMSQLGVVSLPPAVAEKVDRGADLTATEQVMVESLPTVASELISGIPRLAPVAEAIRYSRKGFDGSGIPADGIAGDQIPFAGRLLRLLQDYDEMITAGRSTAVTLVTLSASDGLYDPAMLKAMSAVAAVATDTVRSVKLAELQPGMVLAAPVSSRSDLLLINAGQEVTLSVMTRLRNFAALEDGVTEPLLVQMSSPVNVDGPPISVAIG